MEAQQAKRRRVYSLEPNKIVESIFTRNYLNYLVPALIKIKEKSGSMEDNNDVKYEVDMAMVLSAQGFAWSNGLKIKLQRDHVNAAAANTNSFLENEEAAEAEGSLKNIYDQNEPVPLEYFSSNPNSNSNVEILRGKCECKDMLEMKIKGYLDREGDEDEDIIDSQLKRLRRLIPGGAEMCDENMVAELESYVRCLQMQVNALQCLLTETP